MNIQLSSNYSNIQNQQYMEGFHKDIEQLIITLKKTLFPLSTIDHVFKLTL